MKTKIFISILIATLLLCVFTTSTFAASSTSQTDSTGSWKFESYGSGVMLTEYLGSKADVYVPSTVEANGNTYPVLKLSDGILKTTMPSTALPSARVLLKLAQRHSMIATRLFAFCSPKALSALVTKHSQVVIFSTRLFSMTE